jgi:hypothetical protein
MIHTGIMRMSLTLMMMMITMMMTMILQASISKTLLQASLGSYCLTSHRHHHMPVASQETMSD